MTDDEITQHLASKRAEYDRLFATRPLSPQDIPPAPERHIVLSDYHYRRWHEYSRIDGSTTVRTAHDERALAAAERFMGHWKPTHIHFCGDWLDFYAISHFCRERPDEEEIPEALHAVRAVFRRIRTAHPGAVMTFELGNHEARWEKFLDQNAQAISHLPGLTYNALFDAKDLQIMIYPYKELVPIIPGVLAITHGDKVAPRSGMAAHKMLDMGLSGVSGHTHRLGQVFRTDQTGMKVWAENGCLCSLDPSYLQKPNWQQGFSCLRVYPDEGRFHLDNVPIINGRVIYGDEVYEA